MRGNRLDNASPVRSTLTPLRNVPHYLFDDLGVSSFDLIEATPSRYPLRALLGRLRPRR
jgi:uncharacterized SAM-dependent methyltransferase